MSNRSAAVNLSTRTIKIYASAYDGTARADIAEHIEDVANPHAVTAEQVGLGNADNTSDLNKPISTAQAAALALKAPLVSPALSGLPTAPTASLGTITNQLATTQFVQAALNAFDSADTSDDLITAHLADTDNPHQVTAADVGLGNVDNTSDAAKPISTATQAAIDAVAEAASDAQQAADAAQADATQALADAAAAQASADASGVSHRPGDAIELYGATKVGEPETIARLDPAWAAISAAGTVLRITAATAADPQTVAPITAFACESGRVYEVRWRVQRQVNAGDPLNDAVSLGIAWLTNTKAMIGAAAVADIALVVADGVVQRTVRIGIAPPAGVALDYTAPAGTLYFRPYVDVFGDSHTTDIITLEVDAVGGALGGGSSAAALTVNVVTPASGATLTLADLRPVYVANAAVLAALTVKLPPGGQSGQLVEVGFALPVTALSIQDSAGVPIPGRPVNAYGPGSALEFRHIGSGWVYWK